MVKIKISYYNYLQWVIALSLLFVPFNTWAALFNPPPTDQSLNFLGEIFGGHVGQFILGGNANPTLSRMFEKFNAITMSFGIVIISYVGLVSTINTAQEGQPMGKKWSSIWLPMRSVLGILLMVPTPMSGYSVIQIFVMSIIVQGIGAADQIWNIVLDNLGAGLSPLASPKFKETSRLGQEPTTENILLEETGSELALEALFTAVCMETLKKIHSKTAVDNNGDKIIISSNVAAYGNQVKSYLLKPVARNGGNPINNSSDNPAYSYTGLLRFGIPGVPAWEKLCGQVHLVSTVRKSEFGENNANVTNEEIKQKAKDLLLLKKSAIDSMLEALKPLANDIVNERVEPRNQAHRLDIDSPYPPQPAGYYNHTAEVYVNRIIEGGLVPKKALVGSSASNRLPSGIDINQDFINRGKQYGWIFAGNYYFLLAQYARLQSFFKTLLEETPHFTGYPRYSPSRRRYLLKNLDGFLKYEEEKSYLKNRLYDARVYFEIDESPAPISERQLFQESEATPDSNDTQNLEKTLKNKVHHLTSTISLEISQVINKLNFLLFSESDPLVAFSKFGNFVMVTAERAWLGVVVASSLLTVTASCSLSGAVSSLVASFIFTFSMVTIAILGIIWASGATFALYLPLIPFLMFTVTVLGWFLLVIEAMMAAPILLLGFMAPTNEEIGKIIPGIMLIVNIFFRPTLMIFGFILAAKLYQQLVKYLQFTFGQVFHSMSNNSALTSDSSGLLSGGESYLAPFAVLIIYTGLIIALTNKCFALIYLIPDKVMRSIGGSPEQSDIAAIQETKQAFEKSSPSVKDPVQGTAEAKAEEAHKKFNQATQIEQSKNKPGMDNIPPTTPLTGPTITPRPGSPF